MNQSGTCNVTIVYGSDGSFNTHHPWLPCLKCGGTWFAQLMWICCTCGEVAD